MSILDRIVAHKQMEVARAAERCPLAQLASRVDPSPGRPFFETLRTPGPRGLNIIAEIKRASPSKGPIRPTADAAAVARAYAAGGAAALSVLTDRTFFQGAPVDLVAARAATGLPVLRKDFIISDYQVYETKAMGADAVLLICRILEAERLARLVALSRELGLDVLVEVHDAADLALANGTGARLIGINNRDLTTFATDLRTAMDLSAELAPGQVPVAASGIHTPADIRRNLERGVFNFLIGESLMRAENPGTALQAFLGAGVGSPAAVPPNDASGE
jgi:indole-3-glycerol phosphate synthase